MNSVRFRLMLVTGAVLACGAISFVWLAREFVAGKRRADLDSALKARVFAASRVISSRNPRMEPYLNQGLDLKPGGWFLQVFSVEGKPLGTSTNLERSIPPGEATLRSVLDRTEPVIENIRDDAGRLLRVATLARQDYSQGSKEVPFIVQAGIPLDSLDEEMREWWRTLALAGGVIWFVGLALCWIVVQRWLRPLAMIRETTRQLAAQPIPRGRVPAAGGEAELRGVVEAVNRLLDHLESATETQQRFVADASHELRTPLTVLRGEIEVALRKPRSADEYREILQSNREEIDALSRLTENLLVLARADAGQLAARAEPVELGALAGDVLRRAEPRALARKISLSLQTGEPLTVAADRIALERALANLVENAIAYSPPGESVIVTVGRDPDRVWVSVADTGPGIAAEHRPHIFERFYRASKSRDREGAGLGLAIVKAIVEAHGGAVAIESEVGQGTHFTLSLPPMPEA